MEKEKIEKLAKLIRYYILTSTSEAGSGHPTSSLSATDLMSVLFFSGFFNFDFDNPDLFSNDRLLFSKGHATPLLYSLYLAAGQIRPDEIKNLRKFDSSLEGHPTVRFKLTEAATGSLGQGLSIGAGMALGIKARNSLSCVYVLLGDGEMAEGSVWEAVNLASYYKLNNLTAIVDVNRLGQSQATMLEWDLKAYKDRFEAFGWKTIVIDGHNYDEIFKAYKTVDEDKTSLKPYAIVAKTIKGKGISVLENKDGWHGKPLKKDELEKAIIELGEVDLEIRGEVASASVDKPAGISAVKPAGNSGIEKLNYRIGEEVATRKAYGNALKRLGRDYPDLVSLDGDVKNSTYAEIFKEAFPGRFFEMFIAEQNMVGAGVGMARLGFIPFVSSFACFLTRGFDQIRMAGIGGANVKFCGSHAGVSIGEDGPSQMGLEDLSMFRSVFGSTVLYPSDAVSTERLVEQMLKTAGICYIRTARPATKVIYGNDEKFPVGGSKIHKVKSQMSNVKSKVIIAAAGITFLEAMKAQEELIKEGIEAIVVDCYSIKPIDGETLRKLAEEANYFITVEDHYEAGGLGETVLNVFASDPVVKVHCMAVSKLPRSGKPAELMNFEEIDAASIIKKARSILR